MNKTGRATDPSIDTNGRDRTVAHAGTTLHAGIPIRHAHQVFNLCENLVRADLYTLSAGNAGILVKVQGSYPVEISESFHRYSCFC